MKPHFFCNFVSYMDKSAAKQRIEELRVTLQENSLKILKLMHQ